MSFCCYLLVCSCEIDKGACKEESVGGWKMMAKAVFFTIILLILFSCSLATMKGKAEDYPLEIRSIAQPVIPGIDMVFGGIIDEARECLFETTSKDDLAIIDISDRLHPKVI